MKELAGLTKLTELTNRGFAPQRSPATGMEPRVSPR
jgi:hypothetical protein